MLFRVIASFCSVIFVAAEKVSNRENVDYSASESNREKRIVITIANTSIIIMSSMMDAFGELMIQATGSMATGLATALGGEESGEEVKKEFDQKLPEVNKKMKAMISEVRDDLYAQFKQKHKQMQPLLSDPIFDVGPKIVEKYDFGMPKLNEELDDTTLAQYAVLFTSEDPLFVEMFQELTSWMNGLPNFPEKTDQK